MPRMPKPFKWRNGWFTDFGGKRTKLCDLTASKAEAMVKLREVQNDAHKVREKAIKTLRSDISLKELIDLFGEACIAEGLSQKTIISHRMYLRRLVNIFGNPRAVDITSAKAKEARLKLIREGITPATECGFVKTARRLYSWAIESEIIPEPNPFRKISRPPTASRKRVITDDEFSRILSVCRNETYRDIFITMRYTAARPGEIRQAEWHMVDWDRQLLVLYKHKTFKKTKKPRIIYLPNIVINILKRRKVNAAQSSYIFGQPNGQCYRPDSLSSAFTNCVKAADIAKDANGENVVMYSIRHTALTRAARAGVTGPQLQVLAGWSSLDMAVNYVHFDESDIVNIGERVAASIDKQGSNNAQEERKL